MWNNKLAGLAFIAMILFAVPALAQEVIEDEMAGVQNAPEDTVVASRGPVSTTMDDHLARLHRDFSDFSRVWVARLNNNSIMGRNNVQVNRLPNGNFMATFREIDTGSLVCVVKESRRRPGNYTGTLRYHEQVFESVGTTEAEARAGEFVHTRSIATREIFCLKNGTWFR